MPQPELLRSCSESDQGCCRPLRLPLPSECPLPPVGSSTRVAGAFGEELTHWVLKNSGWRILHRNWRNRWGEIDLVAQDADCLVAIEVKLRRSLASGFPSEAITAVKLRRMRLLAGAWLEEHQGVSGVRSQRSSFGQIRLDVFSIVWPKTGDLRMEHLPGVTL